MPLTIIEMRPDVAEAVELLTELDAELALQSYRPENRYSFSIERLLQEGVLFYVARYDGVPAGCGGLKLFGTEYAEVKRMFVRPQFRGHGIGKAVLRRLADGARERGVALLRLETGIYQTEALGLYESFGFRRRPAFGEYREHPVNVFYEMPLDR